MLDQENVQIHSDHEHERKSLKTILDDEQQNLVNLQEESRLRIEQQHADERRQLDRNIEDRLRKLNEQVNNNNNNKNRLVVSL